MAEEKASAASGTSPAERREEGRPPAGRAGRPLGRLPGLFVAGFLGLVILGEVNYLNDRHFHRFDVTANRRYSLSPKSIQIVRSLDAPVRVQTTFLMDQDHHQMARELLTEYGQYSDNFFVAENQDFMSDPTGIDAFARRYEFSTMDEVLNKVVLDYKDGKRIRVVKLEEMVSYGRVNPQTGQRGEASFQGEEKITSAILDLTEARKTGVYFTVGHGELAIGTLSAPGLSKWRHFLDIENYRVETIDLLLREDLPEDCDVIVIVGPRDPFGPEEEETLREFLDGGGRVLLLAGYADRPGLEGLLEEWRVDLRSDLVALPTPRPAETAVGEYFPHPITDPLKGQRITPYNARSVALLRPLPEGLSGAVLFESPREAWGETRVRKGIKEDPEDHEGPVPMAVALEREGGEDGPARLAVVGSAFFVMNARSFRGWPVAVIEDGANDDLAQNLIGWLAARERLVGIGAKKVGVPMVRQLEKGDRVTIFLFCLVLLPGLCLLAGFSLWWVRRG